MDVVVFSGKDQETAVKEFIKEDSDGKTAVEKYIRIHIDKEGILCAFARTVSEKEDADRAIKLETLKVKYGKKAFNWPKELGISDLLHVGDMYDFHLALPYSSWAREACKDAMACKIG